MVQCGTILYLGAEEVWCSVVRCYISRSWLDKLFFFTGDDGRVRVCGEGIAGTWETEAVSRSWGLAVSEPHFMAGNAGACSGISSVGVGRFFGHWFFFSGNGAVEARVHPCPGVPWPICTAVVLEPRWATGSQVSQGRLLQLESLIPHRAGPSWRCGTA